MSLALRLLISFGLLALVPTVFVGFGAREAWRRAEERRFEEQLQLAKHGVWRELSQEASRIRDLLRPKCEHDAYIDLAVTTLGTPEFEERRLAISLLAAEEMKALHLDELLLFTQTGEILGAGHDAGAIGKVDRRLAAELAAKSPAL